MNKYLFIALLLVLIALSALFCYRTIENICIDSGRKSASIEGFLFAASIATILNILRINKARA